MNKDKIEQMCRRAGLVPIERTSIKDADIFIADGFSRPPHDSFRRFGIDATDYPAGCFVTLWWASKKDEELDIGQPLFFEPWHDPSLMLSFRQKARVNSARSQAINFLARRRHMAAHV